MLWYWYVIKSKRRVTTPLPPGPTGLPIFGYIPFLGTNLHEQLTELAHHYGPIYKLQLGNKLCVVVSSADVAKEVVRDQDIIFANPDPMVAAMVVTYGGLDIGWSPYGPYWRKIRKIFVREMLSNNNLEASYHLRRNEVRNSVREVCKKIDSPINIGELIFQTELNLVINMLWGGRKTGNTNFGAEFRDVVKELMDLLGMPNISDFFPVLARFDIQGVERKMKGILKRVDGILDNIMNMRLKSMEMSKLEGSLNVEEKKDFLQILLELKEQEDSATALNMTQIKAMLMDIVVGGTDSSVTLVEWMMAELMSHREVLKKAQDELADVVGLSNIVGEHHLPKLQYLDAVVKETLRLHPSLPLLVPKCPSESSTVRGYAIPKNTKVLINVWTIHRDPKFWDNPSEFKPERFLSDSRRYDYSGNNFHYMPFGSGRRICPGIPLAEKMVMYLLASLLHSFEWQLPKGEVVDLSDNFGIVLRKKTPLLAVPSQRLSNMELYK